MRLKFIALLAASGLLSIALLAASTGGEAGRKAPDLLPAAPISSGDLLLAHNVPKNPDVLLSFLAEAERTISFCSRPDIRSPDSFKRLVTVARDGQAFKYQREDLRGQTRQFELFDGRATYHVMAVKGKLVQQDARPGDSPSEAVGFEIKSFGLLPALSLIADAKTESVYEGRTAKGLDRLKVRTPTRLLTVYADPKHLIRRVEFRDNVIDYDDYRLVQGVWLPFSQRFSIKGQLYYELSFNRIELKPAFPSGYFSRETCMKEIVR